MIQFLRYELANKVEITIVVQDEIGCHLPEHVLVSMIPVKHISFAIYNSTVYKHIYKIIQCNSQINIQSMTASLPTAWDLRETRLVFAVSPTSVSLRMILLIIITWQGKGRTRQAASQLCPRHTPC